MLLELVWLSSYHVDRYWIEFKVFLNKILASFQVSNNPCHHREGFPNNFYWGGSRWLNIQFYNLALTWRPYFWKTRGAKESWKLSTAASSKKGFSQNKIRECWQERFCRLWQQYYRGLLDRNGIFLPVLARWSEVVKKPTITWFLQKMKRTKVYGGHISCVFLYISEENSFLCLFV